MKKLFLLSLLALVGVLPASAATVYKVGLSPGFPPFEYQQDGKIVGFDVDLVSAIASDLGISVEFVPMEFDGLIAALKAGKIQIIASGMSRTPARAKSVEFSKPYYQSQNYYVKHRDNANLQSLQDLQKGAKVGAQLGTLQADEVLSIKGAKPQLNADHMVFVMATKHRKIDAFVLESIVANAYIAKHDELVVFAKSSPLGEGMSIAFAKGNTQLKDDFDAAIERLKLSGEYEKLLEKYNLID